MVRAKIIDQQDEQIVVTTLEARGAVGPKCGTAGDTLLPMLIGFIGLTIVGVFIVYLIFN